MDTALKHKPSGKAPSPFINTPLPFLCVRCCHEDIYHCNPMAASVAPSPSTLCPLHRMGSYVVARRRDRCLSIAGMLARSQTRDFQTLCPSRSSDARNISNKQGRKQSWQCRPHRRAPSGLSCPDGARAPTKAEVGPSCCRRCAPAGAVRWSLLQTEKRDDWIRGRPRRRRSYLEESDARLTRLDKQEGCEPAKETRVGKLKG